MITLVGVLALLVSETLALELQHVPSKKRHSSLTRQRVWRKTRIVSCVKDYRTWNGVKFFVAADNSSRWSFFSERDKPTNIIHIITPLPLDPEIKQLWDHHREQNPDYEIRMYDTPQMIQFMKNRGLARELDAFSRLNHIVMRADLFRLILMVHIGGVYFDDKAGIVLPLKNWLPSLDKRAVFMTGSCGITNWFMAARAQHPVMVTLLDSLVNKILNGFSPADGIKFEAKVWWLTGPFHYTSTISKFLGEDVIPCIETQNPTCPYEAAEWKSKMFTIARNGTYNAEMEIMSHKLVERHFLHYRTLKPTKKGHAPSRMVSYHKLPSDFPMYGATSFQAPN